MTEPEPNPAFDGGQPPPPKQVAAGVEDPGDRYPFWNWRDLVFIAGLAFVLLLLASIGTGAVLLFGAWHPHAKALGPLVTTFIFYGLFFWLLYAFFKLRYRRPFWRSLAWLPPPPMRISPPAWGVLTAGAVIALGALLRPPQGKVPLEQMLEDPVSIGLTAVFAVTLAPLCEELAFRGLLFPVAARTFGAVAGAAITALPFALLHGPEYGWTWQRVLPIFGVGFAFGWMRYKTGSTAAAAVMHAAYNAMFVVALIASKIHG